MYAIVQAGGRQYRVQEGDVLRVSRMQAAVGDEVDLGTVLAVGEGAGLEVGAPALAGAHAVARVLEHGRERKVIVFKYRAKTNYRRKTGHRQPFTRVRVERIETS